MSGALDPTIPLLWINLDRAPQRRARMAWAIRQGGWQAQRLRAVDGQDPRQRLLPWPNPLLPGTTLPGLRRHQEPSRGAAPAGPSSLAWPAGSGCCCRPQPPLAPRVGFC